MCQIEPRGTQISDRQNEFPGRPGQTWNLARFTFEVECSSNEDEFPEVKALESMAAPAPSTIVAAYRNLLRTGLRAVHFSSPARYVLRDTIRQSFRKGSSADFNAARIQNTLLFLDNAAKTRGLEHKILRNVLHYRWWKQDRRPR